MVVKLLVEDVARTVGHRLERMPAGAAQMVGELVRSDGEEIRLQLAAVVEVWQTIEEVDEGFLHHVLAAGPVVDAAFNEGEQPTFIAGNERFPGAGVALADLLDQQAIAVGGHRWALYQPRSAH